MKTWNRFRPRVEELGGRIVPSTLAYSTNWSGYAVSTSAGAVTQVSGSWVVPAVSSNVSGYSSAWVGIDGWNSSTVEQIGTDSDYVNGHASYSAWYEMYPAYPVYLSLTIKPGDRISASVSYSSPNLFTLSLANDTTGGKFSKTLTMSNAQRSSAEWIQEAPSGGGVLPLADFGTINFSGASATVSGTTGPADKLPSSTLYQTNMVTNTGTLKASTSALSDSGSPATSSFSVTFVSSGASGRKGHGHKSSNLPPPESSLPISALLPAAVAAPQSTPPAFVAIQSPPGTVPLAALLELHGQPASSSATTTSAHFASATNNPVATPEFALPSGSTQLLNRVATSQTDGLPARQAVQSPANMLGASLEFVRASDASFVNSSWLLADSLLGVPGAFNGRNEGQDVALAGLVLLFALDGIWALDMQGQTGNREASEGDPGRAATTSPGFARLVHGRRYDVALGPKVRGSTPNTSMAEP